MATADQIAALRRAANIAVDDAAYPDALLSALIDTVGSVDEAAARVWMEKAATYSEMVNTTESGSSRSLSDLHRNALELAASFEKAAARPRGGARSHTVPIERV